MKVLTFLVLLIYCFTNSINAKEYSAGWVLWYPYQYHNKSGELTGIDIRAFEMIMKQANIQYTLAEIPWKTQLHFVKTGKVDMAMGAYWSQERCQYSYYSRPYRKGLVKLFVKAGEAANIQLNSLDDILNSSYKIGIERDYFYGEKLALLNKNKLFRTHIIEVVDIEDNADLLLQDKIDGFLAEPLTVKVFVEKYKMRDTIEMHPLEIYGADIHIIMSKKSTDSKLLNKVNSAIYSLQRQGKLSLSESDFNDNNPLTQCNKALYK